MQHLYVFVILLILIDVPFLVQFKYHMLVCVHVGVVCVW